MRSYDLDPNAAAKAGVSNYITETGKYKGKFTVAESIVSQQNTEGVEFAFQTNDGMTANFLQIWTYNKDGKQLSGFNVLSAIMTCLKIKNIAPISMQVTDFRGAAKTIQGFPELCNKPIGLLLQKEEYQKNDGGIGFKFNIVAPFEPNLELTAGEILKSKTSAEQLPKMIATLKDRPMQKRAVTVAGGTGGDAGNWTDDPDIPF
jgi:hypothetical protein